jgi:L-ascorbate metabolism protein UlaG (beta-lactamase superfamily)
MHPAKQLLSVHRESRGRSAVRALFVGGLGLLLASGLPALAQAPTFADIKRITNSEVYFMLNAPTGRSYRVDASTNLQDWSGLLTFGTNASASLQYTDSAAPFLATRYYRAKLLEGTNILSGDHLPTTNGDVVIQPVNHAGFILQWNGVVICSDPASTAFSGLPQPDLILISHTHSDHYQPTVIAGIRKASTIVISPVATSFTNNILLSEGASTNVLGLSVQAVAAYNAYHTRNMCAGYVLSIGGKRIYVSGDTGNQPEVRALQNIDVAFLCMNQPFTMTVSEATNCVRAMRPKVVYPYHYRDQSNATTNAATFKQWLGTDLGIEVRLRKWY